MGYKYYNQKDYPNVLYPIMTDHPESGYGNATVAQAGCGLCAASMVVENMTDADFPLIESLELSMNVGGNHSVGTDMHRFAPYIAERFGLLLKESSDLDELKEHLIEGYMAVAHVTGDRPEDDYIGVFSHGGHYISVVKIDDDGEHIQILDPSLVPGKYDEEGRKGKVIVNGSILHTTLAVLDEDCKRRDPKYIKDDNIRKWVLAEPKNESDGIKYFLFKPAEREADL